MELVTAAFRGARDGHPGTVLGPLWGGAVRRLIWAPWVLFLAGCLCLPIVVGCAAQPKTFDEGLQVMDKFAEVAERQGASWYADLTIDGAPRVTAGYTVQADTGIRLRLHAQGNAQSATAPKPKNPTSGDE